jgi:RHS repeat-associated protein
MLNLANVEPDHYMQWDHRDMIASIYLGGGGTAFYQYDAGKQRTRKRIVNQNNAGGYWERIYLGGYELYRRYNGNGSTPIEEIESHHLFEGEQRVLLVDDVITASDPITHPRPDGLTVKAQTLFRYQYSNHLGSACLDMDESAEIISYEEYHPYGTSAYRAMKSGIEAPPKRYRYTGMERDEESGLSYHAARYYLVWLARWSGPDPAGLIDGPNLYSYCWSRPSQAIDASGLASHDKGEAPKGYRFEKYVIIGRHGRTNETLIPIPENKPAPEVFHLGYEGRLMTEGMVWREGSPQLQAKPTEPLEPPLSPPPLVEALPPQPVPAPSKPRPNPPKPHVAEIEFDDFPITVEKKGPTPEQIRDKIHQIEWQIRQLEPELKKLMEDATSATLGAFPFVGFVVASIYDLSRGDIGSAAQNVAEEGVIHFGEKAAEEVTKQTFGKVPIVGTVIDVTKMGRALDSAGTKQEEMEALRLKRYRLKDQLGDTDARYDDPSDPKAYLGPGGRRYDKMTGKPIPDIQGRY